MNKKLGKKILSLFLVITFVFSAFGIIRATAETKAFTLTDASVKEKSDSVESNVSVKDGNVSDNLVFHKVNDSITYKLTFKNNDSKDYVIKDITDNNSSEYVSYDYDKHKDETIKAGETKEILVKVTYKKEVTDADKREISNPVKLSFEIEDIEGNTVTANVVVNPKTNDGIMMYVALASISLIGISVLLLKNKKSGKLLVMVALLAPITAKAVEASFTISFGGAIKLYDKVLVTTEIDGEKVSKLIAYEDKVTKPADPVKDGADFMGWFVGDTEYNFDKKVSDDVVITAKFKMIEYTVTFDPNGGKVATESVIFTKGQTVNAVVPFRRDGYIFTGWYDSEDENANLVIPKNGSFIPTGNITVYAHWEFGDEPNLVDVDDDQNISSGDIVSFGPEEFIVISTSSDDVYLIARHPLGDVNGIKQTTTNPIAKEFSNAVYWLEEPTPETPHVFAGHGYSYGDDYIDNYGLCNELATQTIENNSLYSIVNEYYTYLRNMVDFYDSANDATLLTYTDAYSYFNCRINEENTCDYLLDDGYSFWLGTSLFTADSEQEMLEGKIAYINADNSSIGKADKSSKFYIRPTIRVSVYDIVVPWN